MKQDGLYKLVAELIADAEARGWNDCFAKIKPTLQAAIDVLEDSRPTVEKRTNEIVEGMWEKWVDEDEREFKKRMEEENPEPFCLCGCGRLAGSWRIATRACGEKVYGGER